MQNNVVPPATRTVFRLASLLTLLAVMMGSVVCATESGFECGNWPGCSGDALLPSGTVAEFLFRNPWIEMIHRTSAILAGPAALASAVLALRLKNAHPLVKILPWVTVAGAIVAGYVGRGIVLGVAFPAWVSAFDLGSALVAMGAMVVATVALERTPAVWFTSRPGMAAWTAVGLLVAMHLVSLYAAGPGSYTRCMSWPVWTLVHADVNGNTTFQVVRIVLAVAGAAAVVAAVVFASREPSLRRPAVAAAALLVTVAGFGALIALTNSDDLGVPFSVATVGLVFTLVLLGARASLDRVPDRRYEDAEQANA